METSKLDKARKTTVSSNTPERKSPVDFNVIKLQNKASAWECCLGWKQNQQFSSKNVLLTRPSSTRFVTMIILRQFTCHAMCQISPRVCLLGPKRTRNWLSCCSLTTSRSKKVVCIFQWATRSNCDWWAKECSGVPQNQISSQVSSKEHTDSEKYLGGNALSDKKDNASIPCVAINALGFL